MTLSPDEPDTGGYAATRFLRDAAPEDVAWLWPGRIPLGSLTLLIGDPGVGKSLLVADLAARVSAALPWPDNPESERPRPKPKLPPPEGLTDAALRRLYPPVRGFLTIGPAPAGVVLACPEDSVAGVLQARLAAAGADPARVSTLDGVHETWAGTLGQPPLSAPLEDYVSRPHGVGAERSTDQADQRSALPVASAPLPLMLPSHIGALEQAIREHDHPRLVVLDPLHTLLSPDAQVSPATLVRLLGGLAETARRYGVAIVAVGHLVKGASSRLLYRVRGSLSFVAAARSVLLLSADPDDPQRRVLSSIKNVFGPPPPPLLMRIGAGPRLLWGDDAGLGSWRLRADLLDRPDQFSAVSEACDWLWNYLTAGPRPARRLIADGHEAGLSLGGLRRAKRLLAVRSRQRPEAPGWLWFLPERTAPDASQPTSATLARAPERENETGVEIQCRTGG